MKNRASIKKLAREGISEKVMFNLRPGRQNAKNILKHLQHQPILIWLSGLDTALILWSKNHKRSQAPNLEALTVSKAIRNQACSDLRRTR